MKVSISPSFLIASILSMTGVYAILSGNAAKYIPFANIDCEMGTAGFLFFTSILTLALTVTFKKN